MKRNFQLTPNQFSELTAYQSRVSQVATLPAKPVPVNGCSSTRCYVEQALACIAQ